MIIRVENAFIIIADTVTDKLKMEEAYEMEKKI